MKPQSSGIIGLASALLFAGAAHAVEAVEVGNRVKDMFARQGVDMQWTGATGSGATVVLDGVSIAAPGDPDRIQVGTVTFEDIEEEDDGDFLVGSFAMPTYAYAREGMDFTVDGMTVTGLLLPSTTSTDPMAQTGVFEAFELKKFVAAKDGNQLFQIEGLAYDIERSADGNSLSFTGSAERFAADFSIMGDPQSLAMATALGLAKPTGSFETSGSFSSTDGTVRFDQMDFTVDEAGTLGLTFDLGGYTPQIMKAMQDLNRDAATATDEQKAAQGMALLGMMQQLNLNGASIRYDEDQLAGRALDLFGGMQNMKRSDFSAMAGMMVPNYLGQYVSPEFAAAVTAELVKFIDAPESLEIRAAPASPVPFAMIGAGAMMAPKSLPETLGVTVVANE